METAAPKDKERHGYEDTVERYDIDAAVAGYVTRLDEKQAQFRADYERKYGKIKPVGPKMQKFMDITDATGPLWNLMLLVGFWLFVLVGGLSLAAAISWVVLALGGGV